MYLRCVIGKKNELVLKKICVAGKKMFIVETCIYGIMRKRSESWMGYLGLLMSVDMLQTYIYV